MAREKGTKKMKREVWVKLPENEFPKVGDTIQPTAFFRKETITESRWIPVSERMPDKPGHYHVIRLDREDWCACLHESLTCAPAKPDLYFTSKDVTHWLEAPPLPVEDEFEKFLWDYMEKPQLNFASKDLKDHMRAAWNAAKELK